ncbi:hypothetical protein ACWHLZ_04115 [Streptomyces chartreusis]
MGATELKPWALTDSGENALRRIVPLGARPYNERDYDGIRSSVVSCATLVEAHVDKVLKHLFDSDEAMRLSLAKKLHAEVEDSIYRSWESRRKWLSSAFGVNITGDKQTQDFNAVIDLRNCIVHGDGRLTDLQVSKHRDFFRIREQLPRVLGVGLNGRAAILTPDTPHKSAAVSRDFILHFDQAVLNEFPNLSI